LLFLLGTPDHSDLLIPMPPLPEGIPSGGEEPSHNHSTHGTYYPYFGGNVKGIKSPTIRDLRCQFHLGEVLVLGEGNLGLELAIEDFALV